ncbi:DUF2868 domain-containing protein [Aestuariicella hydrocarbonica]|uniref:DUF2868 domain-containing protein n=1 Tax=Pseudomaricurvus hydrocarbonicus TaxID=1470433 RepID=A0A9E5MP92_9GAMM|nr:DUF2868 domain-containing protein [Aestuariicella hydrocarbonica]NHO67823.1 DUF2868 domain-containing protein [Aestuariicella hydrocarbonica]
MLSLLMAFIGFGAMAGVLNYSGNQPINVWIPLALFAFIPFGLTLSSFYFSVLSPAEQSEHGHPFLMMLVKKLKLRAFLPYKNLLFPWLFWQAQKVAIFFSLAALLSFFLLATFQDYQFGWSSTLITDNATMTRIMRVITWPWHWFIASPSAELISDTRFSALNATLSGVNENWWLTLVMAIMVYGILPRFLLTLFLRKRFVNKLKRNISGSGDIEQFVVAQTHQASHNPIQFDGQLELPDRVSIDDSKVDLISWQQPGFPLPVVKNLGTCDWHEDEQWLMSAASHLVKPVLVIVDPVQTPTGELADCIDLLKQNNVSVSLVLYTNEIEEKRFVQQLKSWQYFAQRHHIDLKRGG